METTLLRQLRRAVGLIWVALLVALLGLVAVNTLGSRLGYQTLIIRGGSMVPAIPLGSLVATQSADPDSLAVGEIITIRAANDVVYTHRIVSIDTSGPERQFQVRGDANATADAALVPASDVIGRVSFIAPVLGYLTAMLSMPSGIVSILCSLASLLLIYWLIEDLEVQLKGEHGTPPDPEVQPPSTNPVPA